MEGVIRRPHRLIGTPQFQAAADQRARMPPRGLVARSCGA